MLPNTLFANISKLSQELLIYNVDVLVLRAKLKSSKLDLDGVRVSKPWSVALTAAHDDSSLASTSSSSFNGSINTVTASIYKDFNWGGHFAFDNNFLGYNSTSLTTNEFNQSFSYSQDLGTNFLGRDDRKEISIAEDVIKVTSINIEKQIEQILFKFYQNYNTCRLSKVLIKLEEEALKRAVKRRRLVARRLKDGLREKVDLYQAQIAELTQEEALKSERIKIKSELAKLSKSLHRLVNIDEISDISLDEFLLTAIPTGDLKNNKTNLALETKIKFIKNSISKVNYTFTPTISFSTQYKTNDLNEKEFEALGGGLVGSSNREIVLGLNLSWPLNFNIQQVAKAKLNVDLNVAMMNKEKTNQSFAQDAQSIKEQIKILDENITLAQKRRRYAKRALGEYNKLYNLGRANLDQVIRAEESLILTERQFARYLFSREQLMSLLVTIYGKLSNYLITL